MLRLMQEIADDTFPLLELATETMASQPRLSPRELQIVRHILSDDKESTIAARLDISPHTVHTHLRRIYAKLGVSSRVGLLGRVCAEYAVWVQQGGVPGEATIASTPCRTAA